jgi:hypothetical protein
MGTGVPPAYSSTVACSCSIIRSKSGPIEKRFLSMPATPRIPKMKKMKKKRVAVLLVLIVVVIVLGAGYFLHLLPSPGALDHFFESKVTATPAIPLADGADPLNLAMNIPLIADFSSAPDEQYSPLTLRFLDQSRGTPESWEWDFGDSTNSTL